MSNLDKCDKCNSERLFGVAGLGKDNNYWKFQPSDEEKDWSGPGYAPSVVNVCFGDGVELTVCLECGKVQGAFPVAEPNDDEEGEYEEE